MLETINVIGFVGKKPEMETTQGGHQITKFSIACHRKNKQGEVTTWYNIAVWGKSGESIMQYVDKSSKVFVTGDYEFREYTTKTGEKGFSHDINASKVKFLDSRPLSDIAPVRVSKFSEDDLAF